MTLRDSDQRMLKVMEWAVKKGMAKHESDYLTKIGFSRTNISNVRTGHQSFSKDHIAEACRVTGANANWIFGLENNMFRKDSKNPLDRARAALEEIEALLHSKLNTTKKKS